MMNRSFKVVITLVAASAAACSSGEPVGPAPAARSTAAGPAVVPFHGNHRDQIAELAKAAPGLAGVYYDESGALTIAIARDSLNASSMGRVLSWVHSYSPSSRLAPRINVQHVSHGYQELYGAFNTIRSKLWQGDGVTSLGIDERGNRIVITAVDEASSAVLRSRINAWGIPSDMVSLKQRGPTIAQTTLNQAYRPVQGGLEISETNGNHCTAGVNVYSYLTGLGRQQYLLTAGHCSDTWGQGPAGWNFYQPSIGKHIGTEYATAPLRTSGCPTGHSPCLDADVLAIRIDDTVSTRYGAVSNVDASKNIITPAFSTVGTVSGVLVGDNVTMVGMASGKVTGTVTVACADQLVDHLTSLGTHLTYWVVCQSGATYSSQSGDSGAAVFVPSTSTTEPRLGGIHSSTDTNGIRWFSDIGEIDTALTNYYFYWQ
jgi:hypothetical protein